MTLNENGAVQVPVGTNPRFDELFAEAVGLVRTGRHSRENLPVEGGRWPVSLVLRLPDDAVHRVAALAEQATGYAGRSQLRTGHPLASHITVRALEPYRAAASPHDHLVQRCSRAAATVAARTPPLSFRLTGVTLAPNAVMGTLEPVDDRPWTMLADLADELGADAWYEADLARTIFYTNLLHFIDDLDDADGLVDWVARNRAVEPLAFTAPALDVVRYRLLERPDLRCMALDRWAGFAFTGARNPDLPSTTG